MILLILVVVYLCGLAWSLTTILDTSKSFVMGLYAVASSLIWPFMFILIAVTIRIDPEAKRVWDEFKRAYRDV